MTKKVAILQSNYIPWKGYFDIIAHVDEFILYDDMQYTRRDWRNRNVIKTPQGLQWLTIPVITKGGFLQKIRDTEAMGLSWAADHWRALELNYKKAEYYDEIVGLLKPLYDGLSTTNLSQINRLFLDAICGYLGIKTKITSDIEYTLIEGKTERLADLCKQAGGTEYISGPAALSYIDEQVFADYGIRLTWFTYDGYPEYSQLWGAFEHNVSIVDLLFNCGADAAKFIWENKRGYVS